ncbi:MAG: DUF599 domain-containing protein [Spirochaetes bacterium]|nr:DUF599 domain-containing protein [Spirochaetota bacterium]
MTALEPWNEIIALAASALLLAAYHLWLRLKVRRHPAFTVQAVNRLARTAWVESIMTEPGKEVLAVQTLRNSTMAATFLASTAVLLIIGVLSLTGQADKIARAWGELGLIQAGAAGPWMPKLLLVLLDLFAAFFAFSMSVRLFNHVGYLINVPLSLGHPEITPAHVARQLNRAGRFYSIGMRAFYFLVPLVFWVFGPLFLVLSTVGLVAVLRVLDRAPGEAGRPPAR